MKIAVDASRNRSGGAIAHLQGLFGHADPREAGITEVHLFAPGELVARLPAKPWLRTHSPPELQRGLMSQLWWQALKLDPAVRRLGCSALFTTSASSLSRFRPAVVLSQDLSSYEPGVLEMHRGRERLRLEVIKILQNLAFRRASVAVFLTGYASDLIQQSCGPLRRVEVIPHGVNAEFERVKTREFPDIASGNPVRCIYVSNAMMYKHQREVLRAIKMLRGAGVPVTISFVGGGRGEAMARLTEEVSRLDPTGDFTRLVGALPLQELIEEISSSDVFVFASACENLPITLLEGMRAGMPVACSNRGPMPEVLGGAGVYFDPAEPTSIATAIHRLISDKGTREELREAARKRSEAFNWADCGRATWAVLARAAQGR